MQLIRLVALVAVLMAGSPSPGVVPLGAQNQSAPQPRQQDEFVPIDELPPQEQVPAAPMVVAAYMFVWVAFVAYIFTIVKRLRKVETDLVQLERQRR